MFTQLNFDADLERVKELIKAAVKEMRAEGVYLGRHHRGNLPLDASMSGRIAPIKAMVSELIAKCSFIILPGFQKRAGLNHIQEGQDENDALTQEYNQTEKKLSRLGDRNDGISIKPIVIVFCVCIVSLALASCEVNFLTMSFQLVAPSYSDAVQYAIAMTLTILILSHGGPIFIHRHIPRRLQPVFRFILFAIVVGAFLYLGHLRATYLKEMGRPSPSALEFACINTALFLGFYIMAELYLLPNLSNVWYALKTLYDRVKRQRYQKHLAKLDAQRKGVRKDVRAVSIDRVKHMEGINVCKALIQAGFNQAFEDYWTAHGNRPEGCEPPDLDFSLFDF